MSTEPEYVQLSKSWEALEDYLTFSVLGFSDRTAMAFAAIKHVCFLDKSRVPHKVREYLLDLQQERRLSNP